MSDPNERDLPTIDPADLGPPSGSAAIGGVLLAAGTSSRFEDGNKLLATVDGEPLVWHAALTLVQAGLTPRIAVLGRDADDVEDALDGLGFSFVHNPDYAEGQATSVRAGIEAIGPVEAAVIALGDMPVVDPASIGALTAAYEDSERAALAAAHDGQRGNPVLFARRYFDALRALDGDTGGRDVLLGADDAALVETGDPGVCTDVDTQDDLEALQDRQE